MIGKVKVTEIKLPYLLHAYRVYIDDRLMATMGQSSNGNWCVSSLNSSKEGRNIPRRFDSRQEALGFILDEHFFNVVTEHDE